jgi:dihydroneopterin aldolase
MITVELKQVRFFAYHGLYQEEKKTGNDFEVNLAVSYEPGEVLIGDIKTTINYARLFELVKVQFDTPVDLLETLVINIAAEIKKAFPRAKRISISIVKLHPPIEKFTGNVSVSFDKEY